MQAEAQTEERLFHCENGVDSTINTCAYTSTRIKMFPFPCVCVYCLCLRSLASCENKTQHKHMEICCVWPASEHLNKIMAVPVVDFDAYVSFH